MSAVDAVAEAIGQVIDDTCYWEGEDGEELRATFLVSLTQAAIAAHLAALSAQGKVIVDRKPSDEMVERAMKAHSATSRDCVLAPGSVGIRTGISFGRDARKACMRAAIEAALAPPVEG